MKLDNVTLLAIDDYYGGFTMSALEKCLNVMDFAEAKIVSSKFIWKHGECPNASIEGKLNHSAYMIKHLDDHFKTDFVLCIQWDSWIVNAKAWTNEFLKYDYIGAPWNYSEGNNVGCGGFTLRSKKFTQATASDPEIEPVIDEDFYLCRIKKEYLESKHGIRFAPEELAARFSWETTEKRPEYNGAFSFHNPASGKRMGIELNA